jgi:phenylpropionate dioxygenase-like ring-hydroxylating dioxygenase large terminal subunit
MRQNGGSMTLLTRTTPTLDADWYYDPAQYARELEAVWYRDWICVGRADEIARPGDYLVAEVGNERVIVTRDSEGNPRAFFNTCRHRGSTLCTESRGHFANSRIVCPYHAWTYALNGSLIATPLRIDTDDFRREDHGLYEALVDGWGGFLFVNLSRAPVIPLHDFLGPEARNVERWPLAALESVHRERHAIACNWKVFWENYSECYHCPGVHPELCRVMPIYREGLLNYADRPGTTVDPPADPRPRVASGLETWTLDGRSTFPPIEGPSDADRAPGVVFASFTASLYVVAHPDYVRSVRIAPRGPERTELTVDWLLPPGVAATHAAAIAPMLELGRTVIAQDARVCELNQQGLKCNRHERGVLVPQEQPLWQFHEWLRSRLEGIVR